MCELLLLHTQQGQEFCSQLKNLIRLRCWECDELILGVMLDIVSEPRDAFKHTSNQGEVWINGRRKDIGNFSYALLYILLMEDALENRELPDCVPGMYLALRDRYESLDIAHGNWELKGDVIECILSKALQTGSSVCSYAVEERLSFMKFMRSYVQWFDRLLHIISRNGHLTEGPPLVRHLPDLHQTVRLIRELADWHLPGPSPDWS